MYIISIHFLNLCISVCGKLTNQIEISTTHYLSWHMSAPTCKIDYVDMQQICLHPTSLCQYAT